MFPDVSRFFRELSRTTRRQQILSSSLPTPSRTIVGLITNSDDRVPDVLSSFGLKVHHLRHGDHDSTHVALDQDSDIDFAIMSYDVGCEKPSREIFDAATAMLRRIYASEMAEELEISEWRRIYVGDELEKDVLGAINAGWEAVLIDRDLQHGSDADGGDGNSGGHGFTSGGHNITVLRNFDGLVRLIGT